MESDLIKNHIILNARTGSQLFNIVFFLAKTTFVMILEKKASEMLAIIAKIVHRCTGRRNVADDDVRY